MYGYVVKIKMQSSQRVGKGLLTKKSPRVSKIEGGLF